MQHAGGAKRNAALQTLRERYEIRPPGWRRSEERRRRSGRSPRYGTEQTPRADGPEPREMTRTTVAKSWGAATTMARPSRPT